MWKILSNAINLMYIWYLHEEQKIFSLKKEKGMKFNSMFIF